jgi:hypothetical protein
MIVTSRRDASTGTGENEMASNKRVVEIRKALRNEFQQGAVNEMHVAKLRHEMSSLPHRHELGEYGDCTVCFYGTNAYTQSLEQILAETREYEANLDARLFFGGR